MLTVLIKSVEVSLMYSGFLLFELLVSSLFYIATHSLKSAFTLPSFHSSSVRNKCSLLLEKPYLKTLVADFLNQ